MAPLIGKQSYARTPHDPYAEDKPENELPVKSIEGSRL